MAKLAMISQGSSAILNIILDPIFIFYFELGVKGAAIATILAQFLGGIGALYLNFKYNKEIEVKRKFIKFDFDIIKAIYAVGIPSIIMQTVRSFTIFGVNFILYGISEIAVTAYGIFFKIQQLILMPGFGISSAIIPIVAYNYGAKNPTRIKNSIIISIKFGLSLMFIGAVILEVFPGEIFGIFKPSPELLKVGIVCIRIISTSFIFVIVNIIIQSSLQALGYGQRAMYLSLFRTVFIMLPAAFLLAKTTNAINNVWWAFVICEVIAMVVAIMVFLSSYKKRVVEQDVSE
jgi:putative MATE family efflux protein